jgi:hypothetical protein
MEWDGIKKDRFPSGMMTLSYGAVSHPGILLSNTNSIIPESIILSDTTGVFSQAFNLINS